MGGAASTSHGPIWRERLSRADQSAAWKQVLSSASSSLSRLCAGSSVWIEHRISNPKGAGSSPVRHSEINGILTRRGPTDSHPPGGPLPGRTYVRFDPPGTLGDVR